MVVDLWKGTQCGGGELGLTGIVAGELGDLVVHAAESFINKKQVVKQWKRRLIDTGEFFCEHEKNADQIFDDLALALSSQNMSKLAV